MDYFIKHCEERNVLNILSSALKGWTPNWRPALSRDAMQIHENMLNIQYINSMTDWVVFFLLFKYTSCFHYQPQFYRKYLLWLWVWPMQIFKHTIIKWFSEDSWRLFYKKLFYARGTIVAPDTTGNVHNHNGPLLTPALCRVFFIH